MNYFVSLVIVTACVATVAARAGGRNDRCPGTIPDFNFNPGFIIDVLEQDCHCWCPGSVDLSDDLRLLVVKQLSERGERRRAASPGYG